MARNHRWQSRGVRLASMAVVGFVLCIWYQDMRSERTEAWLSAGGTHGTWAAVLLMGLVVGGILGALCGPVMIDLWRAIKK